MIDHGQPLSLYTDPKKVDSAAPWADGTVERFLVAQLLIVMMRQKKL